MTGHTILYRHCSRRRDRRKTRGTLIWTPREPNKRMTDFCVAASLDEVTANFELDRLNDPELWWMCQRFYKLRGMEGQTPSREIEIDGLNISLKPHQAFAAFYMLRSERRRHGGFLADEMGLGKVSCSPKSQAP